MRPRPFVALLATGWTSEDFVPYADSNKGRGLIISSALPAEINIPPMRAHLPTIAALTALFASGGLAAQESPTQESRVCLGNSADTADCIQICTPARRVRVQGMLLSDTATMTMAEFLSVGAQCDCVHSKEQYVDANGNITKDMTDGGGKLHRRYPLCQPETVDFPYLEPGCPDAHTRVFLIPNTGTDSDPTWKAALIREACLPDGATVPAQWSSRDQVESAVSGALKNGRDNSPDFFEPDAPYARDSGFASAVPSLVGRLADLNVSKGGAATNLGLLRWRASQIEPVVESAFTSAYEAIRASFNSVSYRQPYSTALHYPDGALHRTRDYRLPQYFEVEAGAPSFADGIELTRLTYRTRGCREGHLNAYADVCVTLLPSSGIWKTRPNAVKSAPVTVKGVSDCDARMLHCKDAVAMDPDAGAFLIGGRPVHIPPPDLDFDSPAYADRADLNKHRKAGIIVFEADTREGP